jgi:hypothetical protein
MTEKPFAEGSWLHTSIRDPNFDPETAAAVIADFFKACIDLASCTTIQSAYVMLSRVKSLKGLCILRPFRLKVIRAKTGTSLNRGTREAHNSSEQDSSGLVLQGVSDRYIPKGARVSHWLLKHRLIKRLLRQESEQHTLMLGART